MTTVNLVNPFWGASVGPRRYWRLMWMGSEHGIFQSVAEIEFAATPGGADQATGGAAIAASIIESPDNAFDNNTGTRAGLIDTQFHENAWLGYDFLSPVTVAEIRITAEITNFIYTPTAFFVQVSDDNVTWQTVCLHVSPTSWTTGEVRAFAVPSVSENMGTRALARVWRINCITTIDPAAAAAAWFDTEFTQASGGVDLATGGVPFSSSVEAAGWVPAFGFNGILTQRFSSYLGTNDVRLWYCFQTPPNPSHVTLASGNSRQSYMPKEFTVDWTADGMNWNTVASFAGIPAWPASVRREYVL